MIQANTILVLGAHPDDGEFGCGGTIARFCEEGKKVFYAVFSLCEKSIPIEYPKNILKDELLASALALGIPEDNLIIKNYEVRMFPNLRQEILEDLVSIRRDVKPDLVLLPSTSDLHQDHKTLSEEGIRAFKGISILGYEQAWNNRIFSTEAFIRLEKRHIDKKISAIKEYKSQTFRSYSKDSFILSLGEVRGTQISMEYAEAFEVLYCIIE
ncbi:MAG: PIG-L deacetylase family protein [Anaerolineaceae bacterium]